MPLPILLTATVDYFPTQRYAWFAFGLVLIASIRAFCQGRTTDRERDLHARVVLLTGAFTPIGMTLLENLAKRGAHIIALSPVPIEYPEVDLVINALRESTSNEHIFAEHCDLASPQSIRDFCTKFLTGQEHRLDALIFAHEYHHIGSLLSNDTARDNKRRVDASMATFLIITLLLPTLLVAPAERDIRVMTLVNPFYAAAIPTFKPNVDVSSSKSIFVLEGHRSLTSAVLMRHLQRVLDAMPSAPAPTPDSGVPNHKLQKSNIVSVSVSPGFSRADTAAAFLSADKASPSFSFVGLFLYIVLQPLLRILAKSPFYSMQTVLHALFLPTPFKAIQVKDPNSTSRSMDHTSPTELLKPGALYSNCSFVQLKLPEPPKPDNTEPSPSKDGVGPHEDREMGGSTLGQLVWETYEAQLKAWEKHSPGSRQESSPTARSEAQ